MLKKGLNEQRSACPASVSLGLSSQCPGDSASEPPSAHSCDNTDQAVLWQTLVGPSHFHARCLTLLLALPTLGAYLIFLRPTASLPTFQVHSEFCLLPEASLDYTGLYHHLTSSGS